MNDSDVIVTALQYLASRCDYAYAQDGAGFNKPDAAYGHYLAEAATVRELYADETVSAMEMLHKYQNTQLSHLQLPLAPPQAKARPRDTRREILVFEDHIQIRWPSDDPDWGTLVGEARAIPGAQLVAGKSGKHWAAPLWASAAVRNLARARGFIIPEQLNELADKPVEKPEIPVIPWLDARKHLDKVVIVEGEIIRAVNRGNVAFLNFTDDYRDGSLTLVIFQAALAQFKADPAKTYLHKKVRATGRIGTYNGTPRLIIEQPAFLEIVGEGKAPAPKPVEPVKLFLVDNGTIGVAFDAKHPNFQPLLATVKALPDRKWDGERYWTVPLRHAEKVIAAFPGAIVDPNIHNHLQQLKDRASIARASESDFEVPRMKLPLRPFQRAGVEFAELANGRCIIADDMGLGKTPMGIGVLTLHPEWRPAIIVVPTSVKLNWEREINRFSAIGERIAVLEGRKPEKAQIAGATIIIINYDILAGWATTLAAMKPQILICDEAHRLKEPTAKRSKAAKMLATKVPHVLMLTGTPIKNRPKELWPLLNMVDPKTWPEFFGFGKRYCGGYQKQIGRGKWAWDFSGASHLDELHEVTKPFMIRRTKEQVLAELPPKQRIILPLEMAEGKRAAYQRILKETQDAIEETRKAHEPLNGAHLVQLEQLKQAAVAAKWDAMTEWIEDFLAGGEKLVLFAVHRATVEMLMETFENANPVRIWGGDTAAERDDAVTTFQNDPNCRLFVGNIDAAGEGTTLTAASNTAFCEYAWTPGQHSQAEDRTNRIGQQFSCSQYYLVAASTVEEQIAALLDSKQGVINRAVDGTTEAQKFSTKSQDSLLDEIADWICDQ